MNLDDVVSLADAAVILGIDPSGLRAQAAAGRIEAKLVGKTWITTRQEVERYRDERLGRVGRPRMADFAPVDWPHSARGSLAIVGESTIPPEIVRLVRSRAEREVLAGATTVDQVVAGIASEVAEAGYRLRGNEEPPAIGIVRIGFR